MTLLERDGVTTSSMVEKMVQNRLRWFGHVGRRLVNIVVKKNRSHGGESNQKR